MHWPNILKTHELSHEESSFRGIPRVSRWYRIHESVFDIANQSKPAHGCNWIRARELELTILATEISVVGLQYTTIGEQTIPVSNKPVLANIYPEQTGA